MNFQEFDYTTKYKVGDEIIYLPDMLFKSYWDKQEFRNNKHTSSSYDISFGRIVGKRVYIHENLDRDEYYLCNTYYYIDTGINKIEIEEKDILNLIK